MKSFLKSTTRNCSASGALMGHGKTKKIRGKAAGKLSQCGPTRKRKRKTSKRKK